MLRSQAMKHDLDFDPTYGYDLQKLLTVPAPEGPGDFAGFWRRTYAENAALPIELASREISGNDSFRVFEVEFNSLGTDRLGSGWPADAEPFRTGGWIILPRDGKVERGFVIGHGYGGREAPELSLPAPRAAAIYPCARGFHRSARPELPNTGANHVRFGIESRETYLHRGCVAEIWSAVSALISFAPEAAVKMEYSGSSFGGGIGAMALPWEKRIQRAYLSVPSFGNHPLRVTLKCNGSGESIRLLHRRRPEIMEVLAYFDSATAARHIEIPVLFANALFDPAVPPPGQFAVYNAVTSEKELFVHEAGHFTWPGQAEEDERLNVTVRLWYQRSA